MSGNTDDLKGRAKEAIGDMTDNDEMKREGRMDRAAGAVKNKMDDAKDKAEDAVDKARDRINDNR